MSIIFTPNPSGEAPSPTGNLSPVGTAGAPPKIRLPFSMSDTTQPRVRYVNQDSDAELAQCAYVVLATEKGELVDDPDLGIDDPTFRQGGVDPEELRAAVTEAEPRIAEMVSEVEWSQMTQKIGVHVG